MRIHQGLADLFFFLTSLSTALCFFFCFSRGFWLLVLMLEVCLSRHRIDDIWLHHETAHFLVEINEALITNRFIILHSNHVHLKQFSDFGDIYILIVEADLEFKNGLREILRQRFLLAIIQRCYRLVVQGLSSLKFFRRTFS